MKGPNRSIWSQLTFLLCTAALLVGTLTLFSSPVVAGDCQVIHSEYIGCCSPYSGRYLNTCAGGGFEIVCKYSCQGPPP